MNTDAKSVTHKTQILQKSEPLLEELKGIGAYIDNNLYTAAY